MSPASLPYAFPDVPGLALEPMTTAHLDGAAELLIETEPSWRCEAPCFAGGLGFVPGACEGGPAGHARDALAARLGAADCQAFMLSFQGRPLQYQLLAIPDDAPVAELELTLRPRAAARERPSWFWRECSRPVIESCAATGRIQRLQCWLAGGEDPLALPTSWRAFYRHEFGAAPTGEFGRRGRSSTQRWEFPLDLARFVGWPERIRLGLDETVGRVRIWEAAEADLPAVRALVDRTVPPARKAIALRMIDEWWHLDRATILLGARDGELRYARALRRRAGSVAGVSILSGIFDEPEQRQMRQQVLAWAKAAGYTAVTAFVPTPHLQVAGLRNLIAASPTRVVREHRQYAEPFTEIEVPT